MMTLILWMGALIFGFGVFGFLTRRNLILMFLSLELMVFGVSLNFVAFGKIHGNLSGSIFAIMILTIAACEAALALALIVSLYHSRGTLDVNIWQALREASPQVPPSKTAGPPAEEESDMSDSYEGLPKLTPAGNDPLQFPMEVSRKLQDPVGSL